MTLAFRKTQLLFMNESFWILHWTVYQKYFSTLTETGWLTILFDKKCCVFVWGWYDFSRWIIAWFSFHTIPFWVTRACKLPYLLSKDQDPIVCMFSPGLQCYGTYPHKLIFWLSTLLCFCLLVILLFYLSSIRLPLCHIWNMLLSFLLLSIVWDLIYLENCFLLLTYLSSTSLLWYDLFSLRRMHWVTGGDFSRIGTAPFTDPLERVSLIWGNAWFPAQFVWTLMRSPLLAGRVNL